MQLPTDTAIQPTTAIPIRMSSFVGTLLLIPVLLIQSQTTQRGGGYVSHFSIDRSPALIIEDDGTAQKGFTDVVARRLGDGQIAVGDRGPNTIRIFGRRGAMSRALAQSGKGPGELPGYFLLASNADTVFAFGQPPFSSASVSMYTVSDGFVNSAQASDGKSRGLRVIDRLATGQFLVQRQAPARRLTAAPRVGELVADSTVYGLYSPLTRDSGDVVWFAPVLHHWSFAHPWPRGPIPSTFSEYPFRAATAVVVSGDRLWIVDSESGTVRAIDRTGHDVARTRLSGQPQTFDRAAVARRGARELAAATRAMDSARAEGLIDLTLLPRRMPFVSSGVAGPDGEVWLRRFNIDETAAQVFVGLSRHGVEIAELSIPPNIEVQQVGRDFVLGIRHDDVGTIAIVEYVLKR